MKSKIRIDHLQAEAENTEGIRDLFNREKISVYGGSQSTGTRCFTIISSEGEVGGICISPMFTASRRERQRPVSARRRGR